MTPSLIPIAVQNNQSDNHKQQRNTSERVVSLGWYQDYPNPVLNATFDFMRCDSQSSLRR